MRITLPRAFGDPPGHAGAIAPGRLDGAPADLRRTNTTRHASKMDT
jgi:hypothetical protein